MSADPIDDVWACEVTAGGLVPIPPCVPVIEPIAGPFSWDIWTPPLVLDPGASWEVPDPPKSKNPKQP